MTIPAQLFHFLASLSGSHATPAARAMLFFTGLILLIGGIFTIYGAFAPSLSAIERTRSWHWQFFRAFPTREPWNSLIRIYCAVVGLLLLGIGVGISVAVFR